MRRGFVTALIVSALLALPIGFVSATNRNNDQSQKLVHEYLSPEAQQRMDQSGQQPTAGDEPDVIDTGDSDNANDSNDNDQAAEGTDNRTGAYVALGDSVAAGLGLSPRSEGTDRACGVTEQAYPSLVAKSMNYDNFSTFACSGATAGDLLTEQHLPNTRRDIEPQLDRAFAGGVPSLITITAGANDIQWANFIRKCYASTCGTDTDKAVAKTLMVALRWKIDFALRSIENRSGGQPPRVVMTGYYKPFSSACRKQQTRLTIKEIQWLNSQTAALNRTISRAVAAHKEFARFAAVDFDGHQLCTKKPWIQGAQDAAPFHPTAEGQQAIAKAVQRRAK